MEPLESFYFDGSDQCAAAIVTWLRQWGVPGFWMPGIPAAHNSGESSVDIYRLETRTEIHATGDSPAVVRPKEYIVLHLGTLEILVVNQHNYDRLFQPDTRPTAFRMDYTKRS